MIRHRQVEGDSEELRVRVSGVRVQIQELQAQICNKRNGVSRFQGAIRTRSAHELMLPGTKGTRAIIITSGLESRGLD